MAQPSPATVLDLGAGKGALIEAAFRSWPGITAITVDNDPATSYSLMTRARSNPRHTHLLVDGLDLELPATLAQLHSGVGAAVCNPPYVRFKHRAAFNRLVDDVGLPRIAMHHVDVPADLLFLAQNLRVVGDGGQVGMLVPDGFISGELYSPLRRSLCERHRIDVVIELPCGTFSGTEARTHVLVVTSNATQEEFIPVRRLGTDGVLSDPLFVSTKLAETRLDYSYHQYRSKQRTSRSATFLKDIPHSLTRGSLSSVEAKRILAFHTTDFNGSLSRRITTRPPGKALASKYVVAEPGDILIARVGRRLYEQVCIVSAGSALITDCIFRLRVPVQARKDVLRALVSTKGRAFLESASRGAGPRYLSRSALQELRIR